MQLGELVYKIEGDVSGLSARLDEAEQKIAASNSRVEKSNAGMTSSVFKGVAAWDLLKGSVGKASDFIVSSVQASIEAQAAMEQVRVNVQNAGLAYDDISGKLADYSEKMVKMGFDDEDTATSVSKLTLVTKDYDKALALNQLAMDLARSKNISLSEATALVTQVTQGNNKVLKQYGIELDDSASSAENLDKLQGKVKGSAEAFGKTAAGQLAIANAQWGNIKETVGDQLIPVLVQMLTIVNDNLPAITALAKDFGETLAKVVNVVVDLANAWAVWTNNQKFGLDKALNSQLDAVAENFNKVSKGVRLTGEEIAGMDLATQKSLIDKYGQATERLQNVSVKFGGTLKEQKLSFAGVGAAAKGAGEAQKKAADEAEKAAEEAQKAFEDLQDKIVKARDAAAELADEFEGRLSTAVTDFKKAVAEDNAAGLGGLAGIVVNTEKEIAELKVRLSEAKDEEIASIQATIDEKQKILTAAEGFDERLAKRREEREQRLAGLRTTLGSEADPAKRAALEAEIAARQIALDQMAKEGSLDEQVVEARRVASLDEFTRYEEEMNKRADLREAAFVSEFVQLTSKQAESERVEQSITDFLTAQVDVRQDAVDSFAANTITALKAVGSEARSAVSALNDLESRQQRTGLGKAMGGFTDGNERVHSGEFVAPRWMVSSMSGLFRQLEQMRQGGTTMNQSVVLNASVDGVSDIRALGKEFAFELAKL